MSSPPRFEPYLYSKEQKKGPHRHACISREPGCDSCDDVSVDRSSSSNSDIIDMSLQNSFEWHCEIVDGLRCIEVGDDIDEGHGLVLGFGTYQWPLDDEFSTALLSFGSLDTGLFSIKVLPDSSSEGSWQGASASPSSPYSSPSYSSTLSSSSSSSSSCCSESLSPLSSANTTTSSDGGGEQMETLTCLTLCPQYHTNQEYSRLEGSKDWRISSVECLINSPTDPIGKFLRDMHISASQAIDLNIMTVLEDAPKKPREKYGPRKHLTDTERLEQSRRRNREHAKSTRLRRKIFKKLVDSNKKVGGGVGIHVPIDVVSKNEVDGQDKDA